jgi:hypothetical protein
LWPMLALFAAVFGPTILHRAGIATCHANCPSTCEGTFALEQPDVT